jgi:hypothetical protein
VRPDLRAEMARPINASAGAWLPALPDREWVVVSLIVADFRLENGQSTGHIGRMGNECDGGVYVVGATKGGKTEYWAAATPRDEAVGAVLELLPPGWSAVLTDRRIKPDKIYDLKLKPNGVRQMKRQMKRRP